MLPVVQTPFGSDESIDDGALRAEIDWIYEQGARGTVVGMVSEYLRLSDEERDALAAVVANATRGRGEVVVSVGSESTTVAKRHACHAESVGATSVMAAPPLAVALDRDEIRRHYERILEAVSIPVIVHDAGGYVGQTIPVRVLADLHAEFGSRIAFKPETPPVGPRLSALRDATAGSAVIFDGSGGSGLVDSFRRGAAGTMPGADACWAVGALWDALCEGEAGRADAISGPLTALISLQSSLDAFVAVEKYLLVRQGVLPSARVRGPVDFQLDAETAAEVDRLFGRLREVVGPAPHVGLRESAAWSSAEGAACG